MLIILFLVLHFNFLFVPCGRLSWLPDSFLLHVKHTLSYRIVFLVDRYTLLRINVFISRRLLSLTSAWPWKRVGFSDRRSHHESHHHYHHRHQHEGQQHRLTSQSSSSPSRLPSLASSDTSPSLQHTIHQTNQIDIRYFTC